jgi:hypothetical protein
MWYVKVLEWERFRCFRHCSALLGRLSGNVLLGPLMWWHREMFFDWNHGGRQCWGVRKSDGVPEHKNHEWESRTKAHRSQKAGRQGISESLCSPQKLWIPLHVPLCPLFLGRWRDFYIPILPSDLRNIPNVNTYKNVFYILWFAGLIPYIYKPATCSHFKPRLLKWHLWLGFF